MSKDKSIPLCAIRKPMLLMWRPVSFLHIVIFFCTVLFSISITTSYKFKSSITVFKKKVI